MEAQKTEEVPDAPKPNQKPVSKKPLFSKRAPVNTSDPEPQEGIDFFSRAKDIFPAQILAQDRFRQENQAAAQPAQTRSSVSLEQESTPRESKRRRLSSYEDEDHAEAGSSRERSLGDSKSTYPTSGSQKSPAKVRASPKPLIQQLTDNVSKLNSPEKIYKGYISLSDDSDNEVQQAAPSAKKDLLDLDDDGLKATYMAGASISISDGEDDARKPELAKWIAIAREKNRQEELAKEKTQKAFVAKNHTSSTAGNGDLEILESDIFAIEPEQNDPIVEIFITSRISGSKEVIIRRKFSQRLKGVRLEWCRRQNIEGRPFTEEETNQVFLTFKMKKTWDVSNCVDMGLKLDHHGNLMNNGTGPQSQNRVHLEAWLPEVMEAYEKRIADAENVIESHEAKQPREKKIKLVLRSKDFKDYKIAVGKTTTFERLVEVFRHQNSVAEGKLVNLRLDGEDLSPNGTVEQEDLEDLVILEVIIK